MPSILTRPSGGGGGSASLSIAFYSDAGLTTPITTANYGQTIYINAVATGVTPNSHSFALTNGTKSRSYIQAGATLTWTVDIYGSVSVRASATDGSVGTSVTASSTLTVSVVKNALAFDGVNDYGVGYSLLESGNDFSVSMWVKLQNTSSYTPLFGLVPLNSPLGRPSLGCGYNYTTSEINLFAWSSEWSNAAGGVITPDTDWHNLVVTYKYSTTTINMYWDNSLLFSDGAFIVNQELTAVILGRVSDWPYVGGKYANVRQTDIRLHNDELTVAQVNDVYNGQLSGNEVQWFPVVEPVGQPYSISDIVENQKIKLYNMLSPYGIVADSP